MKISTTKIIALVSQKGLTIEQCAKLCGVNCSTFARVIKCGRCQILTLSKISRALGIDAAELIVTV